jgi:ankyrin repeat protein
MKMLTASREIVSLCARGNLAGLRRRLANDPDLAADPRLINEAALHGHAGVVKVLLEAGADADACVPSHEFYRPLHRAIEHRGVTKNPGHRDVAELLVRAGASLEARATWMQLPPLAVAGLAGDAEMIAFLIRAGAPTNLFTAAATADEAGVLSALTRNPAAARSADENHLTPLHYAALSGLVHDAARQSHRRIAHLLLDAGADGDARAPVGPYPPTPVLHFAAWKNYALSEVLLGRGCDPDAGFGNCLWKPPGEMAELFLAHGANVNRREASGQPLLNSRIHWNLPHVALWLLEKGADPNLTDSAGNTALHEAASRGINPKVLLAILERRGRPNARNQVGETPLDIARRKMRTKLIPLLSYER